MRSLRLSRVLFCFLMSMLTGCSMHSYRTDCLGWMPIYVSAKDLKNISLPLAKEILKHNSYGQKLCGWEIPIENKPIKN